MDLYAHDLSVLDFNNFYPYGESFSFLRASAAISTIPLRDGDEDVYHASWGERNKQTMISGNPPKHRHDGSSPLPLGMDWSSHPQQWDGQHTVWPHDPPTGWSYCVTIPSWTILPKSNGSDPVVVQVGLQSPEGITATRVISRRFNEFLELFSELQTALPKKRLPQAPPKSVLRMKSRTFYEERRSSLGEWMERLLSDIDVSRSVPVATFLELEAVVRSFFCEVNDQSSEEVSSNTVMVPQLLQTSSSASVTAASIASSPCDDSCHEDEKLMQELDVSKEQLEDMQKQYEEFVTKSKAEVKLLVEEVNSIRGTQLHLKQEFSRLKEEKSELERVLQSERQRMEHANTLNQKLLHDCEILHNRLRNSSDSIIVEGDKIIVETSSPSDAIDQLVTSTDHISLILAEVKLIAQDVDGTGASASASPTGSDQGASESDIALKKMLMKVFVENGRLRMQLNRVVRCALDSSGISISKKDEDEKSLQE